MGGLRPRESVLLELGLFPKLVLTLLLQMMLLLELGLRHDWAQELGATELVSGLGQGRGLELLRLVRKVQGPTGRRNIGLGRRIKRRRWRP
jgi:hypothetical protein